MSEVDQKGKRRGLAEAERRIEKARATGQRVLDLSNLELAAIPGSLAALTDLQVLGLSGNQFTTISDSLATVCM